MRSAKPWAGLWPPNLRIEQDLRLWAGLCLKNLRNRRQERQEEPQDKLHKALMPTTGFDPHEIDRFGSFLPDKTGGLFVEFWEKEKRRTQETQQIRGKNEKTNEKVERQMKSKIKRKE